MAEEEYKNEDKASPPATFLPRKAGSKYEEDDEEDDDDDDNVMGSEDEIEDGGKNKMKNLSLLLICLFLTSCASINRQLGLQDDNLMEESVEAVIKVETGLDIDLTPGSPE